MIHTVGVVGKKNNSLFEHFGCEYFGCPFPARLKITRLEELIKQSNTIAANGPFLLFTGNRYEGRHTGTGLRVGLAGTGLKRTSVIERQHTASEEEKGKTIILHILYDCG